MSMPSPLKARRRTRRLAAEVVTSEALAKTCAAATPSLRYLARRWDLCEQDGEDAAQDVYVRLSARLPLLRNRGLASLVYVAARRRLIDLARSSWRRHKRPLEAAGDPADVGDDATADGASVEAMKA